MRLVFPAYEFNARADRLWRYEILKYANHETPDRWLDLCGPETISEQFLMANGPLCRSVRVPEDRESEWSHRLHFPRGMPGENRTLADLLKSVLSLTVRSPLDCCIALDWYKIPDPDVDPMKWKNTEAGELNYRSKYYYPGVDLNRARHRLITRFSEVINKHPLYRDAAAIVSVAGHKADGRSHGEILASAVAEATGKRLIMTQTPDGPRAPAKESQGTITEKTFSLNERIIGNVVILDDVYSSGATMHAVAKVAKRAGADRIFGLSIVKTMRN
ncbi:phosphoribosyltransferase [Actinacidiphila epipremni]|uniref:Phosphoribosyltransferase n=1 Tax=Actinacidiphila epipremni TaxID=2053013 RepID=A0ABX0ZN93_9ACTN|nr:phosphoribosyltransferase [Actinacidiphila epipremni]NJP44475.1 phosphoribosyltransferase [Actinacidiphila epipremni]